MIIFLENFYYDVNTQNDMDKKDGFKFKKQ